METTGETDKTALTKACFYIWREVVKEKKAREESSRIKLIQKEKLDNLVRAIKKYKREKQDQEVTTKIEKAKACTNNFKNRFEAQKSAIENLTAKLQEKDRLIEELKLGIFDKAALKSLNDAKFEIREIFANSSAKVQCKVAPPPDYNEQFMIQTQKAPKIIQEMEERAAERAKRREIILERKRILEETRQRIVAEALERKRVQDEEETKKNLDVMKERRRKEMERQKIRQINKVIFMEKYKKAVALYNHKLLEKSFQGLFQNYRQNKENYEKSILHYKISLLSKMIYIWKDFIAEKYEDKNALADACFSRCVLEKSMKAWRELHIESIRSMQVAEDFYDLLLVNNTFIHWHRHVCVQIMLMEKKMKMAQNHHDRRLLFHSFYQWRTLPAVLQLEKSKEMKLKKWREKVWAILPDYRPPNEDNF